MTMPPAESDMAAQLFKDPYLFDFLGTADPRREAEVEQALVDHIQKFLLELGTGFAFLGRQVRLEVGGSDYPIDLLFYHLKLRRFVVIELKARDFTHGDVGQLNLYLSAVDDLLKHPDDQPTIGLLLCRTKNRVVAEYALRGLDQSIAVAAWQTQLTDSLPEDLRSSLPSIEEIEAELAGDLVSSKPDGESESLGKVHAKTQSKEEEPMSKKTKALGASASLREPEKQDSKPTLLPKLRFPEFHGDGEWTLVTFGALRLDVSDGNYSSKYPSQSDFLATGVPFLRANNLRFGTVSDDDMRFISEEQHSQITKGHLKKGDILITTRGELGTVALVPDRHIGSNINAQIVRINAGNKLANTFLYQLLDYSRVIGLFDALSTGTALKQLPIGKLNQLALPIPEVFAEQQRIASCLTSLDDLIAAETQKFEALKTHKKGLMQQLFPSPEEVK